MSSRWVRDLPTPKGKGRKKRLKPNSQERFVQWLRLKKLSMGQTRVSQLMQALEVAEFYHLAVRFTERALGPILAWTGRKGQGPPPTFPA